MVFTHQHNDHNADFWSFFVQGWGSPTGRRALNLVGPGVQTLYDTTYNYYESDLIYRQEFLHTSSDGIKTNVNITEFDGVSDYEVELDGVKITAIPAHHTIEAYALKFEADGQSIVISGDFMYPADKKESEAERMTAFIKDTDIAVVDAMLFTKDTTLPPQVMGQMFKSFLIGHVSAAELIQTCADAAPKKVVLTHFSGTPELSEIAPQFKDGGYTGELYLPVTGDVIEP